MTVAAMGALAGPSVAELAEAQRLPATQRVRPVVVSSRNGNRLKDAAGLTCIAKAFHLLTTGTDVLDSLIAGVNIIELDPRDDSVGYGALPNADGVVQLDAAVMHGPLKRAGGVACLEGVRTPSLVAKKVMEDTDHHLLVGRDAQRFARSTASRSSPT
jgi:N4-(beta-N-acetylglucosaminyl)-L-asparaginase